MIACACRTHNEIKKRKRDINISWIMNEDLYLHLYFSPTLKGNYRCWFQIMFHWRARAFCYGGKHTQPQTGALRTYGRTFREPFVVALCGILQHPLSLLPPSCPVRTLYYALAFTSLTVLSPCIVSIRWHYCNPFDYSMINHYPKQRYTILLTLIWWFYNYIIKKNRILSW